MQVVLHSPLISQQNIQSGSQTLRAPCCVQKFLVHSLGTNKKNKDGSSFNDGILNPAIAAIFCVCGVLLT
jgi:hypothetical protein